ncbi:MAG: hypothetical protein ABS52_14930 [Gemmatimonadetes bacterium SCN 70-22]|nr:MAG: hypothetical protein ABS52_14930 [Gemmatimonadetes bacterium SCN 70-22]
MARLSPSDYDALERAVTLGRRLSVIRRGTEYLVVPSRLFLREGREAIEAIHPTTGDTIVLMLDEIDTFEVVR